jgi:hypothetical protein
MEAPGAPAGGYKVPESDKRRRKRIQLYLRPDGSIDQESLTDEQRGQLGIGGATPGAEATPAAVPPEMVGMLLRLVVQVEAAVVGPKVGIKATEAAECLTPDEPVYQGITETGARVLGKYAGPLSIWADEIALCSMILIWQTGAFQAMRALAADRAALPVTPQTAPGPVPIRPNPQVKPDPPAPAPDWNAGE